MPRSFSKQALLKLKNTYIFLFISGPRPLIQGNFRNKFSRQNPGLPIIEQKKEDNKFFINAFHSSKSKNKSTIRGHKNSDFCLQFKKKEKMKKSTKNQGKIEYDIILNL